MRKGKVFLFLTGNMESAITLADKVFKLDESGLHEIQMAEESEDGESSISEASVEIDKDRNSTSSF